MYAELHCHSNYSFQEGASSIGDLLVRAEELAGLPKLAGGRWHPYRRLFATELAHVPAKTAAMLGGWRNPATMQNLYQQPTGESLYAAAMEVGKGG